MKTLEEVYREHSPRIVFIPGKHLEGLEAVRQHILAHDPEVLNMREALEKISAMSSSKKWPISEATDNYDDHYNDGYSRASYAAALVARQALANPTPDDGEKK